jgi:DNA processing protein
MAALMSARARIVLPGPIAPIARGHAAWPAGLDDLRATVPRAIYVAGELPPLAGAVAIVGTRYADPDAIAFTHRLSSELAQAGRVVVSGGADGVDAAAHEGCLAAGGSTVAVLATGLLRAYPAHRAPLFGEIARQGGLVCESVDPNRVGAWSFLRRNRLIAALAECVILVQAPARSGALSTARWAKSLKRKLFVVPAAPWDVRGEGGLALLRSGAQICTSVTDVLSLPALPPAQALLPGLGQRPKFKDDEGLLEPMRSLWRALQGGSKNPDELGVSLDMPAARVQEGLLTLILMGRSRRCADGSYENTRSP